ncbi:MAG TPA: ATP-dependent RecD-like DNA helicase, partial [Firmicutes bacterium]|nr:ATP-dependent RecD-like DNA helicase [Bacillota bacterium]
MDRLQGTLERVTFYSEETCYLVGRLKVKGLRELQTIVGVLPNPVTGEVLNLQGVWILHPEYGRQFKIEKFTRMTPVTVAGIERYLASGVIKGVGPATAKLLIEKFGKDVLDIIEKEPERLREINGIGAKKAAMITESFANQKEMQQVILFFQEYGISPGYAARIYRALGEKTIPLVREDPYRLVDQVFGIGFKTADMIARKIG